MKVMNKHDERCPLGHIVPLDRACLRGYGQRLRPHAWWMSE